MSDPGERWRLQSVNKGQGPGLVTLENVGVFDELVVGDWIHLERMQARAWWMRIGERFYWITIPESGPATMEDTTDEGGYPEREL